MTLLLKKITALFNSPWIVLILMTLLFTSLQLVSSSSVDSQLFGRFYYLLLAINIFTLFLFIILIAKQAVRLYQQRQQNIAGSKLTFRIVSTFVLLVFLPTIILYVFSLQFIHRSIDSWFDKTVESALFDAMELSKATIQEKKKNYLNLIRQKVDQLDFNSDMLVILMLNDIRQKSGADEVSLLSATGKLMASTSMNQGDIVPNMPGAELLLPLQQGQDFVHVDFTEQQHHRIRVLVRKEIDRNRYVIVQALFFINKQQAKLALSVQQAFTEYKEQVYLRNPLKNSFTVTLSLVLFLGLLGAIWAAFVFSKRLSSPLRELSEATQAMSEGKYHHPIPLIDAGDMGQLIQSFNKMRRRLEKTHRELEKSHEASESQRIYLQAVLSSLSSGVIALDKDLHILTINEEASQILGVGLEDYIGCELKTISNHFNYLRPLIENIIPLLSGEEVRWQQQLSFMYHGETRIVIVRAKHLSDEGIVIVIEDVTTLFKAQKEAAWGEVARRLAHEIKNPLTPIQLSAERIGHKFGSKVPLDDQAILHRLTSTIVMQVDNMKELVKSFTEYAQLPSLKLEKITLYDLLFDVIDMYQEMENLSIHLQQKDKNIHIYADAGKLRQVLHNLIKNAIEAADQKSDRILRINVELQADAPFVQVAVQDNGGGIPLDILPNIFDPYITGKSKGSGLGLAIVKKIIDEHGGSINAENIVRENLTMGTKFVFTLPVDQSQQEVN